MNEPFTKNTHTSFRTIFSSLLGWSFITEPTATLTKLTIATDHLLCSHHTTRVCYKLKVSCTLSAIISAMAREDVAAGEGELRTCMIRLPSCPSPWSKTKSSTRLPSLSKAWARTPVGPLEEKDGYHDVKLVMIF